MATYRGSDTASEPNMATYRGSDIVSEPNLVTFGDMLRCLNLIWRRVEVQMPCSVWIVRLPTVVGYILYCIRCIDTPFTWIGVSIRLIFRLGALLYIDVGRSVVAVT
jgi:hypothetical protein